MKLLKIKKISKQNTKNTKNQELSSILMEQITFKKTFSFSLNPNIHYVFGVYFILILDSLTKVEIQLRKNQNISNCYINFAQITAYLLFIPFTLFFEIFFRRNKKERFYKYHDLFYSIISLVITVSLYEERLWNLEANQKKFMIEGIKLMIIQIIWLANFIEVGFLIFSELLMTLYLILRNYDEISENIIIFILISCLFLLQIIRKKNSLGFLKYKDVLNNMKKKNITTFLEENDLEPADFNYLFENLLNQSSDGFVLYDNKMDMIFNNKAILDLFPDFKADLKNEVLSIKITDLDEELQKLVELSHSKKTKLLDLNNILLLKQNSNILDTITLDDENEGQINLKKILELVNRNMVFISSAPSNKLIKEKDYNFGFKTMKPTKNDPSNLCSGGLSVFSYKMKKLYLVCFKKEMVTNKILDNFNKVIDHISNEITNSLNCLIIMLQMLQSSIIIPKKLIVEFVNPALISTKFLINLKNEMSDIGDILRGKIVTNFREFNLQTLVLEIISLFTFQCESKGIDLCLKYDDRIATNIKSDPRFINQILTTLISFLL